MKFPPCPERLRTKVEHITPNSALVFNPTDQNIRIKAKLPNGTWTCESSLNSKKKWKNKKEGIPADPVTEQYRDELFQLYTPLATKVGDFVANKITLQDFVNEAAKVGISDKRARTLIDKLNTATRSDLVNTNPAGEKLRPEV